LFSRFPRGSVAVGLLLLRVALGATAIAQGGFYLVDDGSQTSLTRVGGLLFLASGASVLIGFLLPVAGVLLALAAIGVAASWFPAPAVNLFDEKLLVALIVVVDTAMILMGPGSLSLDARLFGPRQIIISEASRPPKT
jgi:cytochrome c biogenesis factor